MAMARTGAPSEDSNFSGNAANRTVFADVENGEIRVGKPDHNCPEHLLRDQLCAMREYLHILEVRAVIEGINLSSL